MFETAFTSSESVVDDAVWHSVGVLWCLVTYPCEPRSV